MTFNLPFRWRD